MRCGVDSILVLRTDEKRVAEEVMKCEVDSILVLGTDEETGWGGVIRGPRCINPS